MEQPAKTDWQAKILLDLAFFFARLSRRTRSRLARQTPDDDRIPGGS